MTLCYGCHVTVVLSGTRGYGSLIEEGCLRGDERLKESDNWSPVISCDFVS